LITHGDTGVTRTYQSEIISAIKVRRSPNILILGSGIRFNLESQILRDVPTACITSVDYQQSGETVGANHKFEQVDMNISVPNLDANAQFDFIIACEMLEHLLDDRYFWKTLSTHMRPTTIAFVSFPNLTSLFCRFELALGLQPHVLEPSSVHHTAGMGIGGRFNYGPNPLVSHPLGHIRGVSFRAFRETCTAQGLTIEDEFGYMNSIRLWPKKRLVGLSGTILAKLRLSSST
jgi:hypothetical protein